MRADPAKLSASGREEAGKLCDEWKRVLRVLAAEAGEPDTAAAMPPAQRLPPISEAMIEQMVADLASKKEELAQIRVEEAKAAELAAQKAAKDASKAQAGTDANVRRARRESVDMMHNATKADAEAVELKKEANREAHEIRTRRHARVCQGDRQWREKAS